MITVVSLRKTCSAFPAQWEGRTDDDRPIYVRYRWGELSIDLGEPGASVSDAIRDGEQIFSHEDGTGCGEMSEAELAQLTAHLMSWPFGGGEHGGQ